MALTHSTPIPFPKSEGPDGVFQPLQQDIIVEFAEQFTGLQGKFSFCSSEDEVQEQLQDLIDQQQWTKVYSTLEHWTKRLPQKIWTDDIVTCDAALTECEALVARTGSIILTALNSGRITSVYTPVHVCIAYTSQISYDIKDALLLLQEKYGKQLPSMITFATGPSRTADIEKTLVVGVHGPKEVYCFLIDDLPH
ncbi:MAG TPA: LUD domain-containing protein [Flavisolibacter sp.]|nr:LUD domain-containing protein [Flavisolibacter sp.]